MNWNFQGNKKGFANHMRRNPTQAEKVLSKALLNYKAAKFKSQVLYRGWILDFYNEKYKICVEVDGPSHWDRLEQDMVRDRVLAEKSGIVTLRVSNDEVIFNMESVMKKINAEVIRRS
jgi:leucyl-tRNA synthetase